MIPGSLRTRSTNLAALRTADVVASPDVSCVLYAGLGELPHFSVELDIAPLPAAVEALRTALESADAVLFSFPEYAGSLPGSFKNLLDWTVGGGLYRKPIGYINTSPLGAAQGAQAHFRAVVGFINADIIENACVQVPVRHDAVDGSGLITDAEVREHIAAVVATMVAYLDARPPLEVIA